MARHIFGTASYSSSEALKKVEIGEGTESIPSECFRKCAALESVKLPDSVKSIECGGYAEMGAFAECPLLKSVSIGKSIESISQYAFRTCGEVLEVTFREGVTKIPDESFRNRKELKKVTLPSTLTAIGDSAFHSCTGLAECIFPESLKTIGTTAFAFSGLTEAILPGCSFGNAAFYQCEALKKVEIGEGTETIPSECFRKCAVLESATLPDSVKSIECGGYAEMGAFAECPLLKSVSIGKSIETISPHAFRTTGEELGITFREGVTAIPEHALDKAPVTSLILPQTVTAISAEMISGCGSLKEIEIQAYDCYNEDSEKTIPASAVIKALDGSTAQKHAEKYQLAFESTLMQGDLNGDKVVSVEDAQLVLNAYTEALAGKEMNLNAAQIKAGDVDGNGTISVEDAQYILTYYTEMTITGKAITWKDILPQKSV